jgi:hypothetical protein
MQPVIPAYVAPVILTALVVLAAWVARTVAHAAADANLPPRTRTRVTIAAALALGAWLLAALLRAPAQAQVDASGRGIIPVAFAIFAVLSLAAVFGALALSDAWRRTVAAILVERLVAVQTFRVVGFVFVALWAIGSLPGRFALPAGLGVLVRLFAPGTALEPAAAMTMFPLVLVPTFGVPLAVTLHLLTYRALANRSSAARGGPAHLSPHTATAR